jgi:hypothetical protein
MGFFSNHLPTYKRIFQAVHKRNKQDKKTALADGEGLKNAPAYNTLFYHRLFRNALQE